MLDFQVDLSNCDREPIHIPGQIQSHGFLLVIDSKYIIQFLSENTFNFLGDISAKLLGQPLYFLESIIGDVQQPDFITQLLNFGKGNNNFKQTNPFEFSLAGVSFNLIISTSAEFYLLEFEPAVSTITLDIQSMVGRSISEMLGDKNLKNLLNNAAVQVKNIIHYDRVMVYRFAEDGHGEVIAEAKNDDLNPWLGLHYPASDIPRQARELYKLNLTRLIANVHDQSSRIITNPDHQPLNLTNAQLRAVSPIHIQYLKNMGVASSFSISLLYKNELWGLIACHNYTPLFIDYKSRESAKLIGQILSSALEFRQDEENQQIHEGFSSNLEKISKYLQQNAHVQEALTAEAVNILGVTNATGAVFIYEGKTTSLGNTPDAKQLAGLISWILENVSEPVYTTDNLSAVYPEADAYKHIASGILVSIISKQLQEYIIWFKPELLQKINWAGDPEKQVQQDENGLQHISPRHSFEVWTQTVSGHSEHWHQEEIRSAIRLKEEISYAVNLKAGAIRALNEKLRLAYEELDTFSYTISHDLKNPLAVIRSYAQLLVRDKTIGARSQEFLNRIESRADKMNLMINEVLEYSRIGRSDVQYLTVDTGLLINEIINDLDQVYDQAVLNITVGETPDLQGDRTMLSQVFSNLIGNAVKYSQYADTATVHISGVISEEEICYTIKDNGLGIAAKDLPNIFELFNRMDNVKDIEGSGVGLSIVKRIVDKHKGRIWAESELGEGATFFVAFNK